MTPDTSQHYCRTCGGLTILTATGDTISDSCVCHEPYTHTIRSHGDPVVDGLYRILGE